MENAVDIWKNNVIYINLLIKKLEETPFFHLNNIGIFHQNHPLPRGIKDLVA